MKKVVRYLLIVTIGVLVGIIAIKFGGEGPFSDYVNSNALIDALYIMVLIILTSLIIVLIGKKTSKNLFYILVLAFTLRLLSIIAMSFFGVLPFRFDSNWDVIAIDLVNDWTQNNFHLDINASSNVKYYSILTAFVYYIFDTNPIYMQFINGILSILSILLVYLIGKHLFNEKVGLYSALLISVWPSYIIFTTMQMREAIVILCLLGCLYYLLKWFRYYKHSYLLISMLYIIGSTLFRAQNGVLLSIVVVPFVLYVIWKRSTKWFKPLYTYIFSGILIIALGALSISGYGRFFSFDYIVSEMNYRTSGGSAYLGWIEYSSILDLVLYSPIRLFYFVFTPFPWQVTDLQQFIAFIESFVLLVMLFIIIKNIRKIFNSTGYKFELTFFVIFCILGLTANGLIDSNVGTAMRHKLQYLYLFFILIGAVYMNKFKGYTD